MKPFTKRLLVRITIVIILVIFLITKYNNDGRKFFGIDIEHYNRAAGITITYSISQDKISVLTNCDLANCNEKIVYQRLFDKKESDSINTFIQSLHLDTLKTSPATNILDGLFTKITTHKKFVLSFSSSNVFHNYSSPTLDTLYKYVDNLIAENRYKLFHWGIKQ